MGIKGSQITDSTLTDADIAPDAEIQQSKIAGLETAFLEKADAAHTHSISNITGLEDELNNRLSTSGGTITGSVTITESLTINGDLIFNDETGTRIGTGNKQKLAFFGATPITRPPDFGLLQDYSGGVAGANIEEVPEEYRAAFETIRNNFATLSAGQNAIRQVLLDLGLI